EDGLQADLAYLRNGELLDRDARTNLRAIADRIERRLAAHAAEIAKRDARLAELEAHAADRESEIEALKAERKHAEDQAEAASGQGAEGWTIQVDSDGIWATDPDGSSIWLAAPTQEKGNG